MGKIVLALLVLILGVHALGLAFDWYFVLSWFDIPMHLSGGAWVALLFFYIFGKRIHIISDRTGIIPTMFLALGFVALIGVGWEFYEYGYDVFIAEKYPIFEAQSRGLFDALKDLFDDLLGGAIMASFLVFFARRASLEKRIDASVSPR